MHSGTLIGPYEIVSAIGAGGMGEVFRARDTRLNRNVAIKVLPKDFVSDAERLRRFEQEARTLAALNHPNVLTIHDAGVHDGAPYLVSELLEGKTLREEMTGGALPVRKATEFARQITLGLAAAHGKGIIHRDLKPENIFITKDGRVKILDFGLAKLRSVGTRSSAFPTEKVGDGVESVSTIRINAEAIINKTEPGMVLGTPAYMSPEQVRGEAADHRADTFAFGCVLYEMLSGVRAFRRDTPIASMNAVLTEDPPDLSTNNIKISPALERVVRRCLEKDAQNRFQSSSDLAFALENVGGASSTSAAIATAQPWVSFTKLFPWGVAGFAIAAAAALALFSSREHRELRSGTRSAADQVRKVELTFPPPAKANARNKVENVLISPDGRKLLYQNADGLWLRWLDRIAPAVLLTPESVGPVTWSTESTEVAYIDQKKVYRLSISGGQPNVICTLPSGASGPAWLDDDRLLFQFWEDASQEPTNGLYAVSARGGDPKLALSSAESTLHYHQITPLRGTHGALVIVHRRGQSESDTIGVFNGTGPLKILLQLPGANLGFPAYSPTGHVLFGREGDNEGLWAFAFSLEKLERVGEPFRVSDYGEEVSIANDGTLVSCRPEQARFDSRQMIWIDRSGRTNGTVGAPLMGLWSPKLSPDERRIAVVTRDSKGSEKIGIVDTARGVLMPLESHNTRERMSDSTPFWFPDGQRLLFSRFSHGTNFQVFAKVIDGVGGEQELLNGMVEHFSRNGQYLVLAGGIGTPRPASYVRMDAAGLEPVLFPNEFKSSTLKLSPDARLLAYISSEADKFDLYVFAFPELRNRTLVARAIGRGLQWSRSGTELFYTDDNSLFSVTVKRTPSLEISEPVKLFDLPAGVNSVSFDVSADGQRFLMLKDVIDAAGTAKQPTAVLVQNWFEEFRNKN